MKEYLLIEMSIQILCIVVPVGDGWHNIILNTVSQWLPSSS